jgi:hypothetical protein
MDPCTLLRDAVATAGDQLALPAVLAALHPLHAAGDEFAGFIEGTIRSALGDLEGDHASSPHCSRRLGALWRSASGKWEAAPRGVEGWCVHVNVL